MENTDSIRRAQLALLAAAGAGAGLVGWLESFRRSRQCRCVVLHESVPGEPDALFEILRDVEAEPRLIPGVESVTVLERDLCSVRYRVEGRCAGTPWWAVFRKEWEQAPRILTWESDSGRLGLRQVGHIDLQPAGGGTCVTVVACTRFDTPLLGPIATLTSGPLYLEPAFRAWLRNAGRLAALGHLKDSHHGDTEARRGRI